MSDAYDPTTYHPDDVAAGNTPTAAERAADRDAPAFVQYVPEAADPDESECPTCHGRGCGDCVNEDGGEER